MKKKQLDNGGRDRRPDWQPCLFPSDFDHTQFGSTAIALHKAKAATIFKRPTKSFEDRIAAGGAGLTALTLDGIIASEGGFPIVVGGKIVGAMGCSGGTGQQDGAACQAGVNALK